MIWILGLLLVLVPAWYWHEGRWDRKLFRPEPGCDYGNLRARAAADFLRQHPEVRIMDVRSPAEFARGSLPGAQNFPITGEAFPGPAAEFDRDAPLLVYCAGGYRSRKAVAALRARGFRSIHHLHRGFHSWRLAGLPVVKPPANSQS